MAFTLEDGTGVTDSNALISVAEFDTYAADRNVEIIDFFDSDKQGAIITASVDYCDTYFIFPGEPLNEDQGMQLPTNKVALNKKIKSAIAAAALLSLQGRLFVAPKDVDRKAVISTTDSVGPLSTSKTYSESSEFLTKYPTATIDRILNRYAVGSGLGILLRG